jgi:leader peptidase (prepilin peptidase)/N-methyltransferase
LLSFIIQRGKCRGCKSKISWQYPVVECVTGLLFVGVFLKYPNLEILPIIFSLILMSILISITVYDIKHKIIPDGLVVAFGVLALAHIFLLGTGSLLWSLLAGPILALPLFLIWLVSKGEWMGLGDPKLVLCIGWFLGLIYGLSAVVLAFWTGAIYGLALLALSKLNWHGLKINRKSELPFAPFLVLGFLLVFFFGFDVFGLLPLLG